MSATRDDAPTHGEEPGADRLLLLGEMSLRFLLAASEREVHAAACACVVRLTAADHAGVTLANTATGEAEIVALESPRGPLPRP